MLPSLANWIGQKFRVGGEVNAMPRARRKTAKPSKHRIARFEICEERGMLSSIGIVDVPVMTNPLVANFAQVAPAVMTQATGTKFVTTIYVDLLSRQPDNTGLTIYTNMLMNGTPPATVVNSIWQSAEHRGIEVNGYYQTFLHRAADTAGQQIWVNAMLNGMSEASVMAAFLNSGEYLHNNMVPTNFVRGLYRDLLGRTADVQGLTVWVNALNAQTVTPLQAAQAFINSHERHVKLVDSNYTKFLGRSADAAGELALSNALDSGALNEQTLAVAFLTSTEFLNSHPLF